MKLSQIMQIMNLNDYKLHAARYNHVKEPLDVFLHDKNEWKEWNSWRGNKDEFNKPYIFSIIKFYPEPDIWLFGGIFEVISRDSRKNALSYKVNLTNQYSDLIGRLKITANLPRGRSFKLATYFDKFDVSEILKQEYNGEVFPGYENISLDFTMLEIIIRNNRQDWATPLKNIKGVYLLADKHTGKKYIGSAYGDKGIWSRWTSYVDTGHGGNEGLFELVNEKGIEYVRNNFKTTLIEAWPFKTDETTIIGRETFWKKALLTRGDFGYNKN